MRIWRALFGIVVILLVGWLAGWYFFSKVTDSVLLDRTHFRLKAIAKASSRYFHEHGSWPAGMSQLYPPTSPQRFEDGWYHGLIYRSYDRAKGFGEVISLGRDGKVGGDGVDNDIVVRFSADK